MHCLEMWQHLLGLHKTKVYTDNVYLRQIMAQAKVSAKRLRWYDTLALIKVDLIHKVGHGNVVPDALRRREEFQAMSSIQILWLKFIGEEHL